MAVFTQIDKAQLNAFWADYDLPPVNGFKGIQAGVQNTNYLVETAADKYVLTLYENTATGVDPDDLPYFWACCNIWARKAYLAPHRLNAVMALCSARWPGDRPRWSDFWTGAAR